MEKRRVRGAAWPAVGLWVFAEVLCGCGGIQATLSRPPNPITSVTPSATGMPNSVMAFAGFEFVSVQGTGEIVSYNLVSGARVASYATPCADPSGMVATRIAGANVMAAVCYDTNSLLTLSIGNDGSLHALGSVDGLVVPYPGIALDGTDVLVPIFGSGTANGGVAKVSIAAPAAPAITGTATLASPAPGEVVNASSLAVAGGFVYVAAGSESAPQSSSSSIQVISEGTMTLMGSPLTVAHSPQQVAIAGTVAYVTLFDATEFESIDISNPAALQAMEIIQLTTPSCHAEPVAVQSNVAYVGCFAEGNVARFDVSNPARMEQMTAIDGIASPQSMTFAGNSLLVTDATTGGQAYVIDLNEF